MTLSTALRVSWSTWLAIPFLVLAWSDLQGPYDDIDYGLALTAHAMSSIFVIGPLAAVCAAHDGSRMREAGWLDRPRKRSVPTLLAHALWITWTVPTMALVGSALVRAGLPGADWAVIVTGMCVMTACVLTGFCLGVLLAPVVAMPAVAVVSYLWFTLPLAMEPLWLRHLNGAWFSCCAVDTQLSGDALMGAVLVCAAVVVAAVSALGLRRTPAIAALTATIVLVAGFLLRLGSCATSVLIRSNGEPRPSSAGARLPVSASSLNNRIDSTARWDSPTSRMHSGAASGWSSRTRCPHARATRAVTSFSVTIPINWPC